MADCERVRIDKWLWAVRVYKTRALAAKACVSGGVRVGALRIKPSHLVKLNELVTAKTPAMTRTLKVLGFVDNRVGAKLVDDYLEDLTSEEEKEKAKNGAVFGSRQRGQGRPTKRDRRLIAEIFE